VASRITAVAPLNRIPLYVRAGRSFRSGPQSSTRARRPTHAHAFRLHGRELASFELYEDDGLSYGYEKGESARIPAPL